MTEHEPSCDVLANKNAECGSPATVIPVGNSISIHTLAPPLYSPAALYRASPDSISVSNAPKTSMFWTILYLLPTIPMTSSVSLRTTASRLFTCLYSAWLTPCISICTGSISANKGLVATVQSSPACFATSLADVAFTSVPPRFQALRLLSTNTCVIALPF